ncbi:MAG: hypothetical protein CMJ62_05735 [Planctomycetaceae bacterium]|nr:hypothetical protein [Planctomycetaceae bacterium]
MAMIAWARTYSVLLPGIMATFSMSPGQGGKFIATIEGGSFFSLLLLGFAIERIGATRVVLVGLPTVSVSLVLMSSVQSSWLLVPTLVLLGSGMAWTATGVNTLMAATGERRSFYLGVTHSAFSAISVVAPLIAGWVLVSHSWQTWYRGVSVLILCVTAIVWRFEVSSEKSNGQPDRESGDQSGATSSGPPVLTIGTICLGVFAMAGVQGVFNSWSYLYVTNLYEAKHEFASFAPACFWCGILGGRVGLTWAAQVFSVRALLILSSLIPALAIVAEYWCSSPWVALAAMLFAGIGVSGAYQLGTQWAAERLPHRIGTASTAVMACCWLGVGLWPWAAGVLIEETSYSGVLGIALAGSLVAALSFVTTSRG